jgi:hypothetical protein
MKLHLAALASALALIAPMTAVAKDHQAYYGFGSGFNAYSQGDDNEQGDRDDNDNRGNSHHCTNPAGNERGWCKKHHRGIYNRNGYNGNNGYPNPNNGQYPNNNYNNNCNSNGYNNGGRNGNVVLRGVITGVNGNTLTLLQALSTITIDDSLALQYGRVNGSLYPTRSVTVTGYYDNNGYFRATTIS